MAMMSGALYDALKGVGSDDLLARKAAEEVADIRTEFVKLNGRFDVIEAKFDTIKWMVGVNMTLTVLGFGGTLSVLWRMAAH